MSILEKIIRNYINESLINHIFITEYNYINIYILFIICSDSWTCIFRNIMVIHMYSKNLCFLHVICVCKLVESFKKNAN